MRYASVRKVFIEDGKQMAKSCRYVPEVVRTRYLVVLLKAYYGAQLYQDLKIIEYAEEGFF